MRLADMMPLDYNKRRRHLSSPVLSYLHLVPYDRMRLFVSSKQFVVEVDQAGSNNHTDMAAMGKGALLRKVVSARDHQTCDL